MVDCKWLGKREKIVVAQSQTVSEAERGNVIAVANLLSSSPLLVFRPKTSVVVSGRVECPRVKMKSCLFFISGTSERERERERAGH